MEFYQWILDVPPTAWCAHGGYGKRSYNKKSSEKKITQAALLRMYKGPLFNDEIRLFVIYGLSPAPSLSEKKREHLFLSKAPHLKRPDLDNLNKFYLDSMKGIVYKDDSQVTALKSFKKWAETPFILTVLDACS